MNDGTVYIYANVWYVHRDMINIMFAVIIDNSKHNEYIISHLHYLATRSHTKCTYRNKFLCISIYCKIAVVHSISLEFARRA